MALDHRGDRSIDWIFLGGWIVWISFWFVNGGRWFATLSFVPLLILLASIRWSPILAAFLFLIVSWILSRYSLLPSGPLWLSLFCPFLVFRLIVQRIEVAGSKQAGIYCLVIAIFYYLSQFFFLSQVTSGFSLNLFLISRIAVSCVLEAVAVLIISKWILPFMRSR